jgi:hypothetical protein
MDREADSMIGCHGRDSQSRRERSKRAASNSVNLPTSLAIKVGWWEECGAFTTTAGLTFALDKSEKGYRTRTMSFLE